MRKWIGRFEREGNVERKSGPGRPRTTNNDQNTAMIDYLRANPFSTASRAAAMQNVSYRTALRRIHESELDNFTAAHETKLTDEHRRARIQYCHYMLDDFGEDNFHRIIFTDEKTYMSDENITYVYGVHPLIDTITIM